MASHSLLIRVFIALAVSLISQSHAKFLKGKRVQNQAVSAHPNICSGFKMAWLSESVQRPPAQPHRYPRVS